jgi:hypothetical protein
MPNTDSNPDGSAKTILDYIARLRIHLPPPPIASPTAMAVHIR